MSLQNHYHRRTTSPSHHKPCELCYKPTTTVLITPDSRDFFYVCVAHLSNPGFAKPADDTGGKKDDAELEREIEEVKKEHAERQKRRESRKKKGKKGKEKEKDDDEEGLEKKDEEGDEKQEEKERDAKIKGLEEKKKAKEEGPRVFVLDKSIFQSRLNKIQAAALARKRREQFSSPGFLPSVPKGELG